MQKLKVNDEVVILAGKDRTKTGKVVSVNLKTRKVTVAGVNMVKKSVKPDQENPGDGFKEMEKPIAISNVAVLSPKTKKATRVRIETQDGKRVRVACSCGTVLN